jgi:geranylgeranyl pyrophosphate synthase
MSTSEWYNKIEVEVSDLTTKGLAKALNKFEGVEREILSNLFVKKIDKNKNFRPLIFFIGYCLAKGKLISLDELSIEEKEIIGEVTAAIEAENIATYYINHYLDQKSDIKDKQDEKNRVLAGVMSRNIAQEIIEGVQLDDSIKYELIHLIKEIDKDIAKAQIFEVNTMQFAQIDNFKDDVDYLTCYMDRCRNISGQFYGRSAKMGYIVGSRSISVNEERNRIEQFYTEMITLLQYANDIGDYALPSMHTGTVEKNFYKDFGSDFKNQRLTYPNYLLLKRAKNPDDKILIDSILINGFDSEKMGKFIKMMNTLKVFEDCFALLNNRFNKEKKKLWVSHSELRSLISSSVIVVRSNKFLTSIKKLMEK